MHTCMLLANPVLSLVSIFFFEVCFYIYIYVSIYSCASTHMRVCLYTHTYMLVCAAQVNMAFMHAYPWLHDSKKLTFCILCWLNFYCLHHIPPLSPKVVAFAFFFFFSIIVFFFHILCFKLVALSYLILQSSVLSLF